MRANQEQPGGPVTAAAETGGLTFEGDGVRTPASWRGGATPVWGYRPYLDGLRAVAVYLVLAFHAGADRISGGFIGVDVFFVLSGYLVTRLLLTGLGGDGSVSLVGFYARRVRRLLPAAAVNLAVTAVVFRAIASATEMDAAKGSMQAAALYVSNWWFIRESADYFGSPVEASPVLQYWSLSVEEQYYLLWPLVLSGLLALTGGRRPDRRRLVGGIVVMLGLVSLAAAFWIGRDNMTRAYYGTDTRAYQLLAGATLVLLPGIMNRVRRRAAATRLMPALSLVALGGLLAAATSVVDLSPVSRGAVAAALSVALIVSLESAEAGPVRWFLSRPTLALLGRISYGTYLWHWIVVLVATREFDLTPGPTFLVTTLVATGLASLSYELLETPIRTSQRLNRVPISVVAAGLTLSLVVALIVIPRALDPAAATTEVVAETPAGGTPITVDWAAAQADVPTFNGCPQRGDVLCPIVSGSGPRVLLMGDSHAGMLLPAFEEVARRQDLELSAVFTLYCPWTRNLSYRLFSQDCFEQQALAFDETLLAFDPDLVILVHRTIDDPLDPIVLIDRDSGGLQQTPDREPIVADRVRSVFDSLRQAGRQVLVVEPIPVAAPEDSTVPCLSHSDYLEQCRFVASAGPSSEEQVFRDADASDDGLWSMDLDGAVCPYLPICDPVIDGAIVRYDNTHLTGAFSATLADPIERFMLDNGILDD